MATLRADAVTTPARLATFLGKTLTSSLEQTYILQINALTSFITNYLGYNPKHQAYVEEYDSQGGESLLLNAFPIDLTETFKIERRLSGLNEDDWETVESKYYHIDADAGIISLPTPAMFRRTRKGFRVTYSAGFEFDNSSTFLGDTEGADIEMAAWLLASDVLNRGASGVGIKSESIGDYRVVYQSAMMQSVEVQSLLDPYTRLEDAWVAGPLTPLHN